MLLCGLALGNEVSSENTLAQFMLDGGFAKSLNLDIAA